MASYSVDMVGDVPVLTGMFHVLGMCTVWKINAACKKTHLHILWVAVCVIMKHISHKRPVGQAGLLVMLRQHGGRARQQPVANRPPPPSLAGHLWPPERSDRGMTQTQLGGRRAAPRWGPKLFTSVPFKLTCCWVKAGAMTTLFQLLKG